MSDDDAPVPGSATVIDGTYRIEKGVARGGFSTIYRGRHVEMDRLVALKILKLDEDVQASALERFSQEARLTCSINHPNVVTIYEFGQDERGLLYLAMEWLEGKSLNDHLAERGPLQPESVAEIGCQIAAGLSAAHRSEVLHRDLKPSNVMLARLPTGERHVKLLDFGVATAIDEPDEESLRITHEGMFVGTPRYAAPEQIQGRELTVQTDIYGLGLLLWEAALGRPAVPTVEFRECCAHHLSEEPWRLPDEVEIPDPLGEVIERCLRKDPNERFASCADLGEALERLAKGPDASRTPSPPSANSPIETRRVRTPLVVALLVATATALLVCALVH